MNSGTASAPPAADPTFDPTAAPSSTMGPSRPTDPPVPMTPREAKTRTRVERKRTGPRRRTTASMIPLIPIPGRPGKKIWTRSAPATAPTAGMRSRFHQGIACTARRKLSPGPTKASCRCAVAAWKAKAPRPAAIPTAAAAAREVPKPRKTGTSSSRARSLSACFTMASDPSSSSTGAART